MSGPLDSPRVAPRRRTLACLGPLAAVAVLLGCGSEEPPDRSVSAEAAENITAKLEQIDTAFTDEDCEGAQEALGNLREDVPNVDANAAFREDLSSLLEDLDAQLEEECAASDDETTTSSSTKEDTSTSTETDTVPTETVPPVEEEPATPEEEEPHPPEDEDEGEEEEPAPTPDPPDPPAPEPSIPPSSGGTGGGGSDPSGGVTPPAFESGRKAAG